MRRAVSARYQAPTFPAGVVQIITLIFVTLTFSRGLGMIQANAGTSALLAGLALAGAAIYFVAAFATHRHLLVWVGHALLVCAYVELGAHNLGQVLDRDRGWDLMVTALGGVIWHTLLAARMRPLPPHPDQPRADVLPARRRP